MEAHEHKITDPPNYCPERSTEQVGRPHKHTIPVEWEETAGYYSGRYGNIPTKRKVTVLRCECGDEVSR